MADGAWWAAEDRQIDAYCSYRPRLADSKRACISKGRMVQCEAQFSVMTVHRDVRGPVKQSLYRAAGGQRVFGAWRVNKSF